MTTVISAESRREQILEAATRQFSQFGFAGTSMRNLARDLGVSAPALYRHFPSKLALFEAVVERQSKGSDIREYLENIDTQEDLEDVLRQVSLHLLGVAKQTPEVLKLLLFSSVTEDPSASRILQELRMPYVEFLSKEFRRRVSDHSIRPIDPDITARCYVGMVIGCAMNTLFWNRLEGIQPDLATVVANNVPIFARGLQATVATL